MFLAVMSVSRTVKNVLMFLVNLLLKRLALSMERASVTSWLFHSFLSQRCLDGQRVFIGHCLHSGSLALQYFLPCEISST
jgi:hypothetical protein